MYHSPPVLLLLLLLLCCGGGRGVNAFQLLYTEEAIYKQNGTLFTRQIVGVRCDSPDYGNNHTFLSIDGNDVERNITIHCGAPTTTYMMQLAGYVPARVVPMYIEYCELNDIEALEALSENIEPAARRGGGGGNRRKWTKKRKGKDDGGGFEPMRGHSPHTWGTHSRKFKTRSGKAYKSAIPSTRALVSGQARQFHDMSFGVWSKKFSTQSWGKQFGAQFKCNFGFGPCDGGLGDKIEKLVQALAKMQNAQDDELAALQNWQQGVFEMFSNQSNLIGELTGGLKDVQNITNLLQSQIDGQHELYLQQSLYIEQIKQAQQDQINDIRDGLNETQQAVAMISGLISAFPGAIDDAIKSVVTQMNQVTGNLSAQLTAETNARGILEFTMQRRNQEQATALLSLLHTLRAEFQYQAFKISLTWLAHGAIETAIDDYEVIPFLEDLGDPPADPVLDPLAWRIPVTSLFVFHATNSTLTVDQHLREHRYDIYCSTEYFVKNAAYLSSWDSFLGILGPANCTKNSHSDLTCNCWIERKVAQCITNPSLIVSGLWNFNDSPLFNRSEALCAGGFTGGSYQTYDTPDKFNQDVFEICQTGMYTDGGNPYNQYLVVSTITRQRASLDYSHALCSSFTKYGENAMGSLSQNSGSMSPTVLYGLYRFIESAFIAWTNAQPELVKKLTGDMPERIDVTYNPFVRAFESDADGGLTAPAGARNRLDGRCMSGVFVGISDMTIDYVPVYRVTPVTTNTTITVYTEGIENGVSSYQTAVNADFGGDVFGPTGTYVIGDPTNPIEIYDVPYSDISVGPYFTRSNQITANMVPFDESNPSVPIEWSPLVFENITGVKFDHSISTISADIYLVPITPDGVCNDANRQLWHGSICDWLLANVLSPSSMISLEGIDNRTTRRFTASPSPTSTFTSRYTADVTTIVATLVTQFVTACPIIVLEDAPRGRNLHISNQRGTGDTEGGTIDYRLTREDDCCFQQIEGSVDSGGAKDHFFSVCLDTSEHCHTDHPIVVVERRVLEDMSWVYCTNFTLTQNASGYVAQSGYPTQASVKMRSVVEGDSLVVGLLYVVSRLQNMIEQSINIQLEMHEQTGLPMTVEYISNLGGLFNTSQDIAEFIRTIIDNMRERALDDIDLTNLTAAYNATIAPILAQYYQDREDIRVEFENFEARVSNLSNLVEAAEVALALFGNLTQTLELAQNVSRDARHEFVNQFRSVLIALKKNPPLFGGNPFDAFRNIGNMLDVAIDGTINGVEFIGENGFEFAKAAASEAEDLGRSIAKKLDKVSTNLMNRATGFLDDVLGSIVSAIMQVLMIAGVVIIGGIVGAVIFNTVKNRMNRKKGTATINGQDFVTADKFQEFQAQFAKMEKQIASLKGAVNASAVDMSEEAGLLSV